MLRVFLTSLNCLVYVTEKVNAKDTQEEFT